MSAAMSATRAPPPREGEGELRGDGGGGIGAENWGGSLMAPVAGSAGGMADAGWGCVGCACGWSCSGAQVAHRSASVVGGVVGVSFQVEVTGGPAGRGNGGGPRGERYTEGDNAKVRTAA